jgi:hypothetical protein
MEQEYLNFSLPSYLLSFPCYYFVEKKELRTSLFLDSESGTNMFMVDYKILLLGNVCWKELLSLTKFHVGIDNKLAKVKSKLSYFTKPLQSGLVLATFPLCDD